MSLSIPACLRMACLLFGLISGASADDLLRSSSPLAGGLNSSEILSVDEAFRFGAVPEETSTQVFWQVMPGYYLYRDKFRFRRVGEETFFEVDMPSGEEREDEIFGRVQVLEGLVQVTLPEASDSSIEVYYQGCAEQGYCYPPQKRLVSPEK